MQDTTIGLDIGGTKIFAARFNNNLEIEAEFLLPTEANEGREVVLKNMLTAIESVHNNTVTSLGIAWAGFVDIDQNTIKKSPNIKGFQDFKLADYFHKQLNIPVKVENDARLFALAEQVLDRKKPKSLLGIIAGTGIGSGIIIDGKIFGGAQNFAGEIGHIVFEKDPSIETEDLFSGPSLNNYFEQLLGLKKTREVQAFFAKNSQDVLEAFEPRLDQLALWIYNLCLTLNPETIVFGGGVGKNFFPLFTDQLNKKVQTLLDKKKYPIKFNIRYSTLKNAGALGAAILAKQ